MAEKKFKRGDFLVQIGSYNIFAIYGGEEYEPSEDNDEIMYSLICYYNDENRELINGMMTRKRIFDYDFGDRECEYAIAEKDLKSWRLAYEFEKQTALSKLENAGLTWDATLLKLKKFDPDRMPSHAWYSDYRYRQDSNRQHTTPPSQTTRKYVSRFISATWEQKKPIQNIDESRKKFVMEQCNKLKWAFNQYSCYGGYESYYYDCD